MNWTKNSLILGKTSLIRRRYFHITLTTVADQSDEHDSIKKAKEWNDKFRTLAVQSLIGDEDARRRTSMSVPGRKLNGRLERAIRDELASSAFNGIVNSAVITDVRLHPTHHSLEILWEASGDKFQDSKTHAALSQTSPHLRSMVVNQRLVARVPDMRFVKDLRPAFVKQVEELLQRHGASQSDEDEAMTEERLRELYPYHDQLRAEQAARKARREAAERRRHPEKSKPPGLELYNHAAGLDYDFLRTKVMRAIQGTAEEEELELERDGMKERERKKKELVRMHERRKKERRSKRIVWDEEDSEEVVEPVEDDEVWRLRVGGRRGRGRRRKFVFEPE